jgi:predicted nucleic acid-binding protein
MTRPVVCDAGPLIHLDQLDSLDLLSDFTSVQIPEVVWAEVLKHRQKALPQPFLQRPAPSVAADFETLALCRAFSLDAGEAACLALLATQKDCLFLTDDAAARLVAEQMKIEVHGTLGLLVRGVRKGKRSSAQVIQTLESLPSRSTLYISPRLLADVIQQLKAEWGIPGKS